MSSLNISRLLPTISWYKSRSAIVVRSRPSCTFYRSYGFATPGHGTVRRPGRLFPQKTGLSSPAHTEIGSYFLHVEDQAELLFCENETNVTLLYGAPRQGHYKDAFHEYLIEKDAGAVNSLMRGTKACAHLSRRVDSGASASFRLRLSRAENSFPFADFDAICQARKDDCDAFYAGIQAGMELEDARLVQRQAFAGMIWNKQYYAYDVRRWLAGDPGAPPPTA